MTSLKSLLAILLLIEGGSAATAMTFKIDADTPLNRLMRVTYYGGQYQIYAAGEITPGTARQLKEFVESQRIERAKVVFDSAGGSLVEGLALGRLLRSLNFDTGVGVSLDTKQTIGRAICASACTYSFAGGVNRFYYATSGRIGVHQFFTDSKVGDIGTTQLLSALIVSYLDEMGVSAMAFSLASTVSSDQIKWLSAKEALEFKLANNGEQPTSVELKMSGMHPYLRIEPVHSDVTGRLLLLCGEGSFRLMAGIVTDPEMAAVKLESIVKTYFEFDGQTNSLRSGKMGAEVTDSVLWLERAMSKDLAIKLLTSKRLQMWTENGGDFRWGASVDLVPARKKVAEYITACDVKM